MELTFSVESPEISSCVFGEELVPSHLPIMEQNRLCDCVWY